LSIFCLSVGMAERHPSEDMEDLEDFVDFEVDSVVDLMVPVADKTLDAELAGVQCTFRAVAGSGITPLRKMETRALVEANAQHRVSFPIGDMAGANECFEHIAGDNRSVKGLNITIGSTELLGLV